MKKELIEKLTKSFEGLAHAEQGVEYWMARDIQELLEYDRWNNFQNVIEKAISTPKSFLLGKTLKSWSGASKIKMKKP